MLDPGSLFAGRYRVLAKLGEGGMGSVYRVQDIELNSVCALKLLVAELVADSGWQARFLREGKALSQITHNNVARVMRMGIVDQQPFLILEFLDGRSLRSRLSANGPLDPVTALGLISQVCDGMTAAHQSHILHRDLKPDNLMLVSGNTGEETVKIVDFGLARLINVERPELSQRLTDTGVLIGTPHYMSPQQCAGRSADERSDIYSLGCVLFECITGAPPFCADSVMAVIHQHCTEKPPLVTKKNGSVSLSALNAIVQKALNKDTAARYQSMQEFREDILLCNSDQPLKYAQISKRQRFIAIAPGVAFLALLGVTISCCLLIHSQLTADRTTLPGGSSPRWGGIHNGETETQTPTEQVDRAVQEYAALIKRGKYNQAIDAIDEALASSIGPRKLVPIIKAVLLTQKSEALLQIGDKEGSKQCAESATIMMASRIDKSNEDNDVVLEYCNGALKILFADNCKYKFDKDSFEQQSFREHPFPTTFTIETALLTLETFVRFCGHNEALQNILTLEQPFAEAEKNPAYRANYWSRAAQASVKDTKLARQYGDLAVELYQQAHLTLPAAETLSLLIKSTTSAEERKRLLLKMEALVGELDTNGKDYEQLMKVAAWIPWHWYSLGNCSRAQASAIHWAEKSRKNPAFTFDILNVYTRASQELNRDQEALAYLSKQIALQRAPSDELLCIQYQRAQAFLLYRIGKVTEAATQFKAILLAERKLGDPYNNESLDLPAYLECCSMLNWNEEFDRQTMDVRSQKYANEEGLKRTMCNNCIKRETYDKIDAGVMLSGRGLLETQKFFGRVALNNLSWHLAGIGDYERSKKYFHLNDERYDAGDEPVLLGLLLGEYNSAGAELSKQMKNVMYREPGPQRNKMQLLIALKDLLEGNPRAARQSLSSVTNFTYTGNPAQLSPEVIGRFIQAAEGRTDEALAPLFSSKSDAMPWFENSVAYQKLFMAKIAKANGHAKDMPIYYAAARNDLLKLLPPNHSALKNLEKASQRD